MHQKDKLYCIQGSRCWRSIAFTSRISSISKLARANRHNPWTTSKLSDDVHVRVFVRLQMSSLDTGLIGMSAVTSVLICLVGRALVLEIRIIVSDGIDLIGSLKELKAHTTIGVPDNVTVHEPGARVVSLEADDCPARDKCLWGAATEEQNSISSYRVLEIELANHVGCEDTSSLTKHRKVMTVQMHGVRCLEVVLNDEVDPRICRAVEDSSVAEERAVVRQTWQSSQCLQGWLIVSDIDGLVGRWSGAVVREIHQAAQEPSDDRTVFTENL